MKRKGNLKLKIFENQKLKFLNIKWNNIELKSRKKLNSKKFHNKKLKFKSSLKRI